MQKKRNADLINERGYDNLPNITPQFGLELQAALAIKQQIFRKPGPIFPEAFVSRIFAHGLEPIADRREQIVEMFFVLSVVELTTGVADLVAAGVAVGLEDVACLEKDLRERESTS
jgi:hypothetical protein